MEISGLKINFKKNAKNRHISIGDSGKMIGIMEEMRPKVTTRRRNLQENVFNQVSKIVEKVSKFSQGRSIEK